MSRGTPNASRTHLKERKWVSVFKVYNNLDNYYMLLLCILSNLQYKNEKILVVSTNKSNLMKDYDFTFKAIRNFNVSNLKTLHKFDDTNIYNFNNLSYSSIIDRIKRIYNPRSSLYYTDYECNHNNISDKVKIVFINIEDIEEIYDKYIFNDVIVFDSINKDQLLRLSGGMSLIIEDKIRVKKISERLYNINAIMPLNIFVNQKIDRFELSEEIDKVVRDELKENGVW